ncbi:PPP family 3-phenylpropionic acid transporter [Paenibacillus phyllosphaerae]|uniref:PPP family 3-phenylpropionic acid transporter n=2 Tax=Paenibacillus phyllosphaerae TaxID=274593 RepID=A0A7W5B529_9BACL|nr:PPP family 3-phenylpropionic acid transporter [Paenibacillus phyllosphaerae]
MLSQPIWGMISDRFRSLKHTLVMLLLVSVGIGAALFQASDMILLGVLTGLMYFFFMPTDPLVESLNYQSAQRLNIPFGSIRMFGALGYAASSLVAGVAIEYYGQGSYFALFMLYGVLALLLCLKTPEAPAVSKRMQLTDMKLFLKDKRTIMFFSLILILAIPHRMNDIFIGVYIQELGGTVSQVGIAWTVMTLSEVVVFAVSHRLIREGKELAVIAWAAFFYALRFLLSSIMAAPIAVVGLQLLQSVSFVLFYAAAIQYLYRIIPPAWKATGQTLLATLLFGISGVVSSTLGGWLFDQVGGRNVYLIMALLAGGGMVYSWAIHVKMKDQKTQKTSL